MTVELGALSGLRTDEGGLSLNAAALKTTRVAHDGDLILVQQPGAPKEIAKLPLKNLLSLLPPHNGSLFSFVNGGKNLGSGAAIFKDMTSSSRKVTLNFKSLDGGPNIETGESEDNVTIKLSDAVTVGELNAERAITLPHVNVQDVVSPQSGMLVYNTEDDRFYGYCKNKWVCLQIPSADIP